MNEYSFNEATVNSKRILYTPSSFAREDLIHLQETGTLNALTGHKSHRSNLDSYLFFIVLNGSGRLTYMDTVYDISRGDCVFIDCNNSYVHETGQDLWTLKWVHFYGKNMKGIYKKYCERGGMPVFHPSSARLFSSILENLYETAVSDDHLRDMRINEILSSLLTAVMENSWYPENQSLHRSPADDTIVKIKEYVDLHYKEDLSLDELSDMFYINKFYMMRRFKSIYGDTVINYHISRRIDAAKRLLRFSDMSVEDVCYECGFKDPNYFSRVFKKTEGKTPSVYRKLWQE